ncbi:MAG: sugar porter family MFS transporter [Planctomycetaceae bacterium]|nr:sugar porter family MFS transporter [Planctomycetaceae bacterium]
MTSTETSGLKRYRILLLAIAGAGGLLYGIDVGIIAGALPYLEATAGLDAQQLSFIVAAVLLGSVLSSLFAGFLSDVFGRKWIMFLSGLLFVLSVPAICLSQGYTVLLLGRLLQGISGGLIGVVIPLYLAECLPASSRGKGTGIFQWLLTFGLVLAALTGLYFAYKVDGVIKIAESMADKAEAAKMLFAQKDSAWRSIFWVSLAPGVLFCLGTLLLTESPRWLYRRGKSEAALAALKRSRTLEQAHVELQEMATSQAARPDAAGCRDSLLSRKYVIPFVLALIILACNQATGVNSILAYVVNILNQAGLPGSVANYGDVTIKVLNCLMTVVAVMLVDRKGRKFLLSLGSAGIVVCLALAGILFFQVERGRVDYAQAVRPMVARNEAGGTLSFTFDAAGYQQLAGKPTNGALQATFVYAYGPFTGVQTRRTDDFPAKPVEVSRSNVVAKDSVIGKFFRRLHLNPFADPADAASASLEIRKVLIGPVPDMTHGWLVAICLFGFMAFFAVGPGVCVWLALSELMPTRIRSNGMSIALLVNQFVSTSIAAVFLPTVGKYGYAAMFFFWAACTVIYFITAAFFLPETKGKTLEEIEQIFSERR